MTKQKNSTKAYSMATLLVVATLCLLYACREAVFLKSLLPTNNIFAIEGKLTERQGGVFRNSKSNETTCSLWAVVITSKEEPTEAIQQVAKLTTRKRSDAATAMDEWCMVVIVEGDTKATPNEEEAFTDLYQSNDNIVYLSINDPEKINQSHPFVVKAISSNSILARKNIGYLYAIAHGAKAIFDFDDEHVLKGSGHGDGQITPFSLAEGSNRQNMLFRYLPNHDEISDNPAFNPYPLMKPSHLNTTWPRGFPLDQINNNTHLTGESSQNNNVAMGSIPLSSVGVIQSVCDGYPDVDIVYRRSSNPATFDFDDSRKASKLLVPDKSFTPYNAYATVHTYSTFWGLLLPFTITDEMADIWRSFFTQRIMHDLNLRVLYSPPMVVRRSSQTEPYQQNHTADQISKQEDLLRKITPLLDFLSHWEDGGDNVPTRIEKLYFDLCNHGFIGLEDVKVMQHWLQMLQDVGYEFPLLPKSDTEIDEMAVAVVTEQPSIYGQPLLAHPDYNVDDEGLTYTEFLKQNQNMLAAANYTQSAWPEWLSQIPPMVAASDNSSSYQRWRPDRLVVKLVLMTKDEWPLLETWVLYHGELLGFENLYIVDDSTDPRCISFLRHARDHWGVNVIFSSANLNQLTILVTQIGARIQGSSDITLKMDTDDFFVVQSRHTPCVQGAGGRLLNCTLTPYAVEDFLEDIDGWGRLAKGQPMKVGYVSFSTPDRALCEDGRGNDIGHFKFLTGIGHWRGQTRSFKGVSDSRSFRAYDLGGHKNFVQPPMDLLESVFSPIGIMHLHFRCHDYEIENNRKACVSHKYMPRVISDEEALDLLVTNFIGPQGACKTKGVGGMKRPVASCHKILSYAQSLECPEQYKVEYYNNRGAMISHPSVAGEPEANDDFRDFLGHVLEKYGATSSTMRKEEL